MVLGSDRHIAGEIEDGDQLAVGHPTLWRHVRDVGDDEVAVLDGHLVSLVAQPDQVGTTSEWSK
ncbi:hypothetical protein GCM10029963_51190 [Micromonospora andamanensis]|nr:hypothetical protein Vwe01_08740 [Micromonospora andamanensis]